MSARISRRSFLEAGALAGARLTVPTTVGALALSSAPAKAIEPMTMIMVAQAGLAVYQMARGGGAGIGSLLRQQTEMLRAISQQITVVDQRIKYLVQQVDELRGVVDALPAENVRRFYMDTLSGLQLRAVEVMRTWVAYRERYGVEKAISKVKDEADAQILSPLKLSRSVLMGDESIAVLPMVCSAWYTEFQLMTACVPYDPERIRSSAQSYLGYFEKWQPRISAALSSMESEAQATARMISDYGKFDDYTCYSKVQNTSTSHMAGGGGINGSGPYEVEVITAKRLRHELSSRPVGVSADPVGIAATFADLRSAGITIPGEIDAIGIRDWRPSERWENGDWGRFVDGDTREARRQRDAWMAKASAQLCGNTLGGAATIASRENQRTKDAIDRCAKALVYYSMQLCQRDAKASIERVVKTIA